MAIREFNRGKILARRTIKYHTNSVVRERIKEQSRKQYRSKTNMSLSTCLHSLQFLSTAAKQRSVTSPKGQVFDCATFSLAKTADMLQKFYQTVWRWIKNGWIPAPVLLANDRPAKPYAVYHIDEVRVLVEEIGKHENEVAYLRKDHVDVIKRIAQRFTETREALNFY